MNQELLSPGEWDWKKSTILLSLPEAAKVCKELVKCGPKEKHVGGHANACLFHFHARGSATARQPVINKNILDTIQWAYIYIHVHELFNVK